MDWVFLYGPPGSGKSSLGRCLAERLGLPCYDLDEDIQLHTGLSIPQIFADQGESGFRQHERQALVRLLAGEAGIVALGGGALLDVENRVSVEAAGRVLCLEASQETLLKRMQLEDQRPLLQGDVRQQLQGLLQQRAAHYASFALRLDTSQSPLEELAWQAQIRLGMFCVGGMGLDYDVRVFPGALDRLGEMLQQRDLQGPLALVTDENVGRLYAGRVGDSLRSAGCECHTIVIPPGEENKNLATVSRLWAGFLEAGLERSSTVVALGGGVVGDLAGFAAATYLRGVKWVVAPTSLLAMVDASLGGKTGADLPQGKNLIGAFHPPSLVLADPDVLATLEEVELRNGMAEVIKHGVIADAGLFELCSQGWDAVQSRMDEIVRRAMAVKIGIIQADPYERGKRAALNLGHTLGHALETTSGYRLRHGEAVAIGMVAAARLAERMRIADDGLAQIITNAVKGLGLPIEAPEELDREKVKQAMGVDKKKAGGKLRYVLPVRLGKVRWGVAVFSDAVDESYTDVLYPLG